MRLPIFPLLIFLILNLLVDLYLWRRLKTTGHTIPARVYGWSIAAMIMYAGFIIAAPKRGGDNGSLLAVMWLLFGYLSIYAPKYIITIFSLAGAVPKIFKRPGIKGMTTTGIIVGCLVFAAMWWGALVNRFNIEVKNVSVDIPELPTAFNEFKIAQISDLHVGTFGTDTTFVSRLVDKVNSLNPDLIVFTGDIVNRTTAELPPFLKPLSRLSAPAGVISILGNHDYGDYHSWPSAEARNENNEHLAKLQHSIGWKLLKDSYTIIRSGGDSIAVIGVENVGDKPFPVYGSIDRAYPDTSDSIVKILLSHNPAHWTDEIANSSHNIALTLAGHTHAMQIEILGMSPAILRYKTWGGLYSDNDSIHKLYVNIGAGTVGFPARIGATPEITLVTLHPARQ